MATLGGHATAATAWPLGLGRRERQAALLRALLLAGGGMAAGYAVYRLYRSQTMAVWREQMARLRAALAAYADAFGTGADTLALLAADLRSFLASDRDELPPSLRQLARLMQSPEVAGTMSATVSALMQGVTGACVQRGSGAGCPCPLLTACHPCCARMSAGVLMPPCRCPTLCSKPRAVWLGSGRQRRQQPCTRGGTTSL